MLQIDVLLFCSLLRTPKPKSVRVVRSTPIHGSYDQMLSSLTHSSTSTSPITPSPYQPNPPPFPHHPQPPPLRQINLQLYPYPTKSSHSYRIPSHHTTSYPYRLPFHLSSSLFFPLHYIRRPSRLAATWFSRDTYGCVDLEADSWERERSVEGD